MNTAEVIQFPTTEGKEQRVADTDDGYTRIANELMEELAAADITLHQTKVMIAIMRKTYGFNKKFDRITNTQISEMTGIPATRVCTAKNRLIERGFLLVEGNQIGINKMVSDWQPNIPQKGEGLPIKGNIPQNGETFPETGNKTFPKSGNQHSPKRGDTKDTITKDKKENPFSFRNSDESQNDPTQKFLSKHPEASGGIYTPSGKHWGTAEDLKTARFIFGRVLKINPTAAEPNWPDWANDIRLIREIDGRTLSEICSLYDWASRHHFWSGNILSPAKLRKQWDTLTVQKSQQPNPAAGRQGKPALDWNNRDWADSLPPGTL